MIVVYTTSHSKNARQWALTNCIQDEDNITLFHVTKTSIGQDKTERNSRPHEQVHPLTNFCQLKKPKKCRINSRHEYKSQFRLEISNPSFPYSFLQQRQRP
ncbi:hypothetical protein YC2023_019436 [Brassica napus]